MIKSRNLIAFVFGLCPLIPVSSNFAYGFVLAVCVWIIFFGGIISNSLSKLMELRSFEKIVEGIFAVIITTFLNFLFQGLFPIIQGAIQTYIYVLGISYIVYLSIEDYLISSDSLEFPITYSILILGFSILREILAFGSISFPTPSGFFVISIPYIFEAPPFRFLGTAGGALILLGLFSWTYLSLLQGSLLSFKKGE